MSAEQSVSRVSTTGTWESIHDEPNCHPSQRSHSIAFRSARAHGLPQSELSSTDILLPLHGLLVDGIAKGALYLLNLNGAAAESDRDDLSIPSDVLLLQPDDELPIGQLLIQLCVSPR